MQRPQRPTPLLGLTFRLVKYFLMALAACTITYIVALVLPLPWMVAAIDLLLNRALGRSLALLGCLWAIAVISESSRY